MPGNIIHICGPERSGKTYMALGLAERLEKDFDLSHVIVGVDDILAIQKKLKKGKPTTIVVDAPKGTPHSTASKYKLVETMIHLAARGNNVIMTGYPGNGLYEALVETSIKFVASRDINIIGIDLHSYNEPDYLRVLGIEPSKGLMNKYDTKFKEAIKK
ncbi:MAG: hypothetical protein QMC78_04600 [Methanocellales archaeon]|nr:hypothetical protein [Methanocellales archaeon]